MFTEDFSVFFDTANGFAVEATIAGVTVAAIYDSSYYDGGDVATQIPTLTMPDADVPVGAVTGASVQVGAPINKTFTLRKPERGNNGLATLILE